MKKTTFPVNYTLVKAPYVHLHATVQDGEATQLSIFDIRLLQPNLATLPSGVQHTLDHLLTQRLAHILPNMISLAPMSCQTGFYLTIFGLASIGDVHDAITQALKNISHDETTLQIDETRCSNYRNHALTATSAYAHDILEQGISTHPYLKSL